MKRLARSDKDADAKAKIRKIFDDSRGTYGVRRVHAELRSQGEKVSRKKVQRLMRALGLMGAQKKAKYHSYKGTVGKVADNLIDRDFKADRPLQKCTTDVSQFNCNGFKAYLSPILDMWNGEIIGWDLALHPDFAQTERMLESAFKGKENLGGLILHSDQGWQYQMARYQEALASKGIIQSMSRKGNCLDNCIMEGFFGLMKNEMFYGHESEFDTFDKLYAAVAAYIGFYNNRRIKEKTNWMPPAKYREAFTASA